MRLPDTVRRARLQALMARQLVNWRDAWIAYSSGAVMPVLEFRNGIRLWSSARDSAGFLFFEIFANGCYRKTLPDALDGMVADIGANIGAFTLDMAARRPSLTIHAYEPDPDAYALLERNVTANGLQDRVRIWNEAVAGAAGTLRLWRGEGSVVSSAYLPGSSRIHDSREAAAVALSTVVERCGGRVTMVKMDCEGCEAEILEHAGASLEAIDHLVAEYHDALVPDVIPRMRRVLDPLFDVVVSEGGRCGPMLSARRRR